MLASVWIAFCVADGIISIEYALHPYRLNVTEEDQARAQEIAKRNQAKLASVSIAAEDGPSRDARRTFLSLGVAFLRFRRTSGFRTVRRISAVRRVIAAGLQRKARIAVFREKPVSHGFCAAASEAWYVPCLDGCVPACSRHRIQP